MRTKVIVLTKRYAVALICGVLAVSVVAPMAFAASRGNSGLPPGPGNPLAALQQQINALNQRVGALEAAASQPALMWIEHLDFLSGDPTVLTTSFNSTNSGVGGGLSGLIIQSSTVGNMDSSTPPGNKVVEKSIQVPPRFLITGVRVCYEWSANATSNIVQIRLAQVQNPPSTASVLLDDATTVLPNDLGPICVDSTAPATPIDPSLGAVLLSFRINTGNVLDKLVLRGVGLHLTPAP